MLSIPAYRLICVGDRKESFTFITPDTLPPPSPRTLLIPARKTGVEEWGSGPLRGSPRGLRP